MSAHVTESLSAYLDGELPAAEQAAVRAHVAGCEECSARLQELAALDTLARTIPVEAPAGYFESLPGRVTARLRSRPRGWGVPTWAWAAAAALVLAVITPLTLREAPSPRAGGLEPEPALDRAEERAVSSSPPAPLATATPAPREEDEPQTPTPRRTSRQRERVGRLEKREAPVLESDAASSTRAFAAAPPEAQEALRGAISGDPLREAGATAGQAGTAARAPVPISDAKAKSRELTQVMRELPASTPALSPAAAARVPEKGRSYEALLERSARSLEEARELRESWRILAAAETDPARADEARVQVVELGAAAWRLGGGAEDRKRLEADAAAYLERPDARQAGRVRSILAALGPE